MCTSPKSLLPDDDTTDLDATAPGLTPHLDGAALEIDIRLRTAAAHLTAVAAAVEEIMLTDTGYQAPDRVTAAVDALLAGVPAP